MGFVPKKPHFFKPVLPYTKHGLLIPLSFIEKFLEGIKLKKAELRVGNRKWDVVIRNKRVFEYGWPKFVEDNNIQEGDFLVFRHDGGLVFVVMHFHPSTLLKPPPLTSFSSNPLPLVKQEKILDDDDHHTTQILMQENYENSGFHGSNKVAKTKHGIHRTKFCLKDKAASSSRNATHSDGHPYFTSTLNHYSICQYVLYIPMKFARSNGLTNRKCEMIMKDEKGRSWPLMLRQKRTHVSISNGFHHFITANHLKEGDSFIIHLLHNGKRPLMTFHRLMEKTKKKQECNKIGVEEEEKETNTHHDHRQYKRHPYFSSCLKPYNIFLSALYIPMDFARSNGLVKRNCEMIMKDDKGRSFPMWLKHNGSHVSICKGFNHFIASNCLKQGDSFTIHLLHNGNKPLMNFICTREQNSGKIGEKEHQVKIEYQSD